MEYKLQIVERALKRSRTLQRSADAGDVARLVLAEIERDYVLERKTAAGHRTWEMYDG